MGAKCSQTRRRRVRKQRGGGTPEEDGQALIKEIRDGTIEKAIALVPTASLTAKDSENDNMSALMWAVIKGQNAVVNAIIKKLRDKDILHIIKTQKDSPTDGEAPRSAYDYADNNDSIKAIFDSIEYPRPASAATPSSARLGQTLPPRPSSAAPSDSNLKFQELMKIGAAAREATQKREAEKAAAAAKKAAQNAENATVAAAQRNAEKNAAEKAAANAVAEKERLIQERGAAAAKVLAEQTAAAAKASTSLAHTPSFGKQKGAARKTRRRKNRKHRKSRRRN